MKGNIYPNLIRVFYTNLKFIDNNLVSHVKGVDMEITHEVWTAVTGLKYVGLRINKGNIGVVEDFNKIQYYRSCLKNPQAQVRTCSIGGLKLNERLLALIVTWILTPRGSNHSYLTWVQGPCPSTFGRSHPHSLVRKASLCSSNKTSQS